MTVIYLTGRRTHIQAYRIMQPLIAVSSLSRTRSVAVAATRVRWQRPVSSLLSLPVSVHKIYFPMLCTGWLSVKSGQVLRASLSALIFSIYAMYIQACTLYTSSTMAIERDRKSYLGAQRENLRRSEIRRRVSLTVFPVVPPCLPTNSISLSSSSRFVRTILHLEIIASPASSRVLVSSAQSFASRCTHSVWHTGTRRWNDRRERKDAVMPMCPMWVTH